MYNDNLITVPLIGNGKTMSLEGYLNLPDPRVEEPICGELNKCKSSKALSIIIFSHGSGSSKNEYKK